MYVSEVVELDTVLDGEDSQVSILLLLHRGHVLDNNQGWIHGNRKRTILLHVN